MTLNNFAKGEKVMKIVHTMIRVNDLDESLKFYCDGLGMKLLKKREYESGRFTNAFVGYGSEETDPVIELTYNWDIHAYDIGNGFGHIALGVPDVYQACDEFRAKGIKIVREPGPMKHGGNAIAFLEDPNGYKIELTTRRE
jgi:lactoylglutathione lyase